jgi:cobalt/nickel transport protein
MITLDLPGEGTMRRLLIAVTAALILASSTPARAHFNMLLPDRPSVKKDEAITFTYQWGHPYEHQLFDAPPPEKLTVIAPDGRATELTNRLEKITLPAAGGKTVTGYQLKFTPDQRGDYIFVLQTPPIWMEEEEDFFQDTVSVVLHVQAQKGWDAAAVDAFQLVPLTRPYGVPEGTTFQARLAGVPKPAGAHVEVERYNAEPPKELPPDEQITRTVKADPNGVATCTLTEAGWWSLTAQQDGGLREREGKKYPVRRRATLWVPVDAKR